MPSISPSSAPPRRAFLRSFRAQQERLSPGSRALQASRDRQAAQRAALAGETGRSGIAIEEEGESGRATGGSEGASELREGSGRCVDPAGQRDGVPDGVERDHPADSAPAPSAFATSLNAPSAPSTTLSAPAPPPKQSGLAKPAKALFKDSSSSTESASALPPPCIAPAPPTASSRASHHDSHLLTPPKELLTPSPSLSASPAPFVDPSASTSSSFPTGVDQTASFPKLHSLPPASSSISSSSSTARTASTLTLAEIRPRDGRRLAAAGGGGDPPIFVHIYRMSSPANGFTPLYSAIPNDHPDRDNLVSYSETLSELVIDGALYRYEQEARAMLEKAGYALDGTEEIETHLVFGHATESMKRWSTHRLAPIPTECRGKHFFEVLSKADYVLISGVDCLTTVEDSLHNHFAIELKAGTQVIVGCDGGRAVKQTSQEELVRVSGARRDGENVEDGGVVLEWLKLMGIGDARRGMISDGMHTHGGQLRRGELTRESVRPTVDKCEGQESPSSPLTLDAPPDWRQYERCPDCIYVGKPAAVTAHWNGARNLAENAGRPGGKTRCSRFCAVGCDVRGLSTLEVRAHVRKQHPDLRLCTLETCTTATNKKTKPGPHAVEHERGTITDGGISRQGPWITSERAMTRRVWIPPTTSASTAPQDNDSIEIEEEEEDEESFVGLASFDPSSSSSCSVFPHLPPALPTASTRPFSTTSNIADSSSGLSGDTLSEGGGGAEMGGSSAGTSGGTGLPLKKGKHSRSEPDEPDAPTPKKRSLPGSTAAELDGARTLTRVELFSCTQAVVQSHLRGLDVPSSGLVDEVRRKLWNTLHPDDPILPEEASPVLPKRGRVPKALTLAASSRS